MFNDKPDKRDFETDQRQTDITQLDQVIVVDQFGQRSIDRAVYLTDRVIDSLYSFLGFLNPATQAFRLFLEPFESPFQAVWLNRYLRRVPHNSYDGPLRG